MTGHKEEEWKDIPGFEGRYQASTLGRIRSLGMRARHVGRKGKEGFKVINGRILKLVEASTGYLIVSLYESGTKRKMKTMLVHRAVAATFLGASDELNHVNHIDFNRKNNKLDNLEWITPMANARHSRVAGRNELANWSRAKLNHEQADEIRKSYATGLVTKTSLSKKFGVSHKTIRNVIFNKSHIYKQN